MLQSSALTGEEAPLNISKDRIAPLIFEVGCLVYPCLVFNTRLVGLMLQFVDQKLVNYGGKIPVV